MPMLKPEKRGSSWRIKVYVGDKKYRSVTGATKAEAIQKAEKLQSELLAEREKPKSDNPYDDLTVSEAMERYVEAKKNTLSPSSYREFTRIRTHNLMPLHGVRLADLTQEQVQLAISAESADHSPKTVRCMHGLLSSTLKMFRPDMTLHTKLPQAQKSEIVIPEEFDVMSLLATVRGSDIDAAVHLGALCGMRMSEILGLRWSKVDFDAKTIHICAAKIRGMDNKATMKLPKTRAGDRTIRMLPAVEAALRRAYQPDAEFVTTLSERTVRKHYQHALELCCGKHYTFHALRHYAASVMILLNIPVKYIADYLGHETEDMVNRIYGHIMRDKKDELFNRLERYYESKLPESCP